MAAFNVKFDYIIAQSVFTHLPKRLIMTSLKSAARAMHRASIFLVNYKVGKRDYEGDLWTQKNITYRPKTMMELINEAGLVATPVHLIHTNIQEWLAVRK
jgi:hypothetical protein